MMTIGEKIKQLRVKRGLSQERLAEILHVSRSAVAKWENNGGIPEINNLMQLSLVFNISTDELLGNIEKQNEETDNDVFKDQRYDIELKGWNDGVYGVYIIKEDDDFLYYYQVLKKQCHYGMIGRKYITSIVPVKEKKINKLSIKEINQDFFCHKSVRIELAKREGLIRGLFDFRDDAYSSVEISSFEKDELHLKHGGTIIYDEITKIEEIND